MLIQETAELRAQVAGLRDRLDACSEAFAQAVATADSLQTDLAAQTAKLARIAALAVGLEVPRSDAEPVP